jgi:hypothetical protein
MLLTHYMLDLIIFLNLTEGVKKTKHSNLLTSFIILSTLQEKNQLLFHKM